MSSKVQIAAIVREIREAQGVAPYDGKRTVYTLADKVRIVELCKAGKDSVPAITYHLKKEKLGQGWELMLRSWVKQYDEGSFNMTSAISVTSRKPEETVSIGTRLETLLLEMLAKGIKEETLHSVVGAAVLKHGKLKIIQDMKDYMTARGLTIDDLK